MKNTINFDPHIVPKSECSLLLALSQSPIKAKMPIDMQVRSQQLEFIYHEHEAKSVQGA